MTEAGDFLRVLSETVTKYDLKIIEVGQRHIRFSIGVRRSQPLAYYHPIVTIEETGGQALLVFLEAIAKGLAEVSEP